MKSWAAAVREAALDACTTTLEGKPVEVTIFFWLPRPKSVKRTQPMVKPDIDKLARCTLDALIGVAFDDDSRICDLRLSKYYAIAGGEGARIEVVELAEDGTRLV
jgi:Holliday junction resolvase RusA-like endonuclease